MVYFGGCQNPITAGQKSCHFHELTFPIHCCRVLSGPKIFFFQNWLQDTIFMGSHDWAGASIFVNMDKYPVVSIWLLGSFSLVFWCLGRDEKPIKLIERSQVLTSRTSSLKAFWGEKREIRNRWWFCWAMSMHPLCFFP